VNTRLIPTSLLLMHGPAPALAQTVGAAKAREGRRAARWKVNDHTARALKNVPDRLAELAELNPSPMRRISP
jgi:hypothetical protein